MGLFGKSAEEKAHELNVKRAAKYLMIMREDRVNPDPARDAARRVAAGMAYRTVRQADYKATEEAKELVAGTYKDLGGVPLRGGRRADLKADPKNAAAAYIKFTVCGSGYDMWMSEQDDNAIREMMEKGSSETAQAKFAAWSPGGSWEKLDGPVLGWHRIRQGDAEFMLAGPGGDGTTGALGGGLDRGSNSISALVQAGKELIDAEVEELEKSDNPPDKIILLLRCHSRGAVAGDQIAVAAKKAHPQIEVEAAILEPVPGPASLSDQGLSRWFQFLGNAVPFLGNTDKNQRIDVGSLDESTVFVSASSGRCIGFDSQQVLGAKRLIISTQDHTAGMREGYVYEGRRYKGSSLNSLPEGIFLDKNANDRSNVPLKLLVDMAAFRAAVDKETSADLRHKAAMEAMQPAMEGNAEARRDTKNKQWIADPLDVRDQQIAGILDSYIEKVAFS